jgi:putative membrane protein
MNILKSFKFNIDSLFKTIILLGFTTFFLIVIISGKTKLYVHPRIIPYMIFFIAIMIIILLFTIKDICKPQRKKVRLGNYIFFIVPLILAFALPAKSMDSESMSYGFEPNANTASTSSGNTDTQPSSQPQVETTEEKKAESFLKVVGNTIIFEDNNYIKSMNLIFNNLENYKGMKIEIVGFVYKDSQFAENEFVPARLLMSCCAADLSPVGFMCRYDKANDLKKDSWVKVFGTINTINFKGNNVPGIIADKIESTSKPTDEYIYPY